MLKLSKRFVSFPGAINSKITHELKALEHKSVIPTIQLLNSEGKFNTTKYHDIIKPVLKQDILEKVYKQMLTINIMDAILYDAQRQGRISFYMTSYGEEAANCGSAFALTNEDVVYAQYREQGVLLARGFTLEEFMNQCFSNAKDYGKGRQMPVHYGSKKLNFHTISSPLGTQIPQAAGAAYALKLAKKDAVCIAYFGDGAASEGDFHAALNMASTRDCPAIFFCRNNGFAISTSTKDQYRGDGIASRGLGYDIPTFRVDGNDFFSVYAVTKLAKEICLKEHRPVLIEAMTYRLGHHSTSDDSSAYRKSSELQSWITNDNPLTRLRLYLESQNYWNETKEKESKDLIKKSILKAFQAAEKIPKPGVEDMFTDVYDVKTPLIERQEEELHRLLKEYPEHFESKH